MNCTKFMSLFFVSFLAVGSLAGCSKSSPPEPAASKAAPQAPASQPAQSSATDTCALITDADLNEILGKGATKKSGKKATECEMATPDNKHFNITVEDIGNNRESAKTGVMMALQKPSPVAGLGDEAYTDAKGLQLIAFKGTKFLLVTGVGMKVEEVQEANKKFAGKIVGKL